MPRRNLSRSIERISHTTDLATVPARDIEAELKRIGSRTTTRSGQADYPYWRKRRAALLRAAQRYRSLTDWEQRVLEDEARYEMNESILSKRLGEVLGI